MIGTWWVDGLGSNRSRSKFDAQQGRHNARDDQDDQNHDNADDEA